MQDNEQIRAHAQTVMAELRAAVIFLTILPASRFPPNAAIAPDFRQGARVFPVVGAMIGVGGGVVAWLAVACDLPVSMAAILAVAAVMVTTGALHEDGLADTADGFGGGRTAERKLEIMDDSRIGTYGVIVLVLSILIRVAALSTVLLDGVAEGIALLIAAEAVSRGALVRLWHDLPAARLGGMSERTGPPDQQAMLIALILSAIIVIITIIPAFGFSAAIVAAALVVAATFGMARLAANQIGGRTGDTLGACQQAAAAALMIGVLPFA